MQTMMFNLSSANFWWGFYGLTDGCGYEDIEILDQDGEIICEFCLVSKSVYRRYAEEDGLDSHCEFDQRVKRYLEDDNGFYYDYSYDEIGDEDFYEVAYDAPTNASGVKPRYTELWHPDEVILMSTVESGVAKFVEERLQINSYQLKCYEFTSLSEAVQWYEEHQRSFSDGGVIECSDQVVEKLSQELGLSEEDTRKKLTRQLNTNRQ